MKILSVTLNNFCNYVPDYFLVLKTYFAFLFRSNSIYEYKTIFF